MRWYEIDKTTPPPRRHNYEPKTAEWVLREADRLIHDDRNREYGDAGLDFEVIAAYWTTYLRSRPDFLFKPLGAKDVALMMALLKIRRESTHPKVDNIVDACGYLALAQKCEDEDGEETLSDTERS